VRVLIVMRAHWPRALIRATLREAGYDALGARDLDEALTYPATEAARGSVRLILLDQRAVSGKDDLRLRQLLERHSEADTVLLRGAFQSSMPGPWREVVQHPFSIADLSERVQQLLSLASPTAHPQH
jgi:DNA-binding response OmpR family regulator